MVDPEAGTVDRRIFSDQDIYEMELERIFARAWNFMCHDSHIPNPGDFFMTFIGEDRVICVRDNDGNPQVLVNTCRHRGNAVCRAEKGHATSFMCTYHGWTYDLKGALVGVPGFKEVYHEELDRENWGLIKAAQVDTYNGFIFARMDPEAPALDDYLGTVGRAGVGLLAARGELTAIPGVQKYTIGCNWKLAVDNLFDWYHPGLSHASALQSGMFTPPPNVPPEVAEKTKKVMAELNKLSSRHVVALGEYGHAIGGPAVVPELDFGDINPAFKETWRDTSEGQAILGALGRKTRGHPNIFPNSLITNNQLSRRIPKGPHATEIWWFTFVDKNQAPELKMMARGMSNHIFGPAGMLEQDDGENWGESTKGTKGLASRQYPIHFAMNIGRGETNTEIEGAAYIQTHVSEHAQLWTYCAWSEWMAAESWAELERNHSPLPMDNV